MIIPVFDVMNGICVSGKSGDRGSYTPLESVYGDDFVFICHELRDCGFNFVYVADLDRIEDCGDNCDIISGVNGIIPVILDNGCSDVSDYKRYRNVSTYTILATESMESLEDVREIFNLAGGKNIIISVDIKNNELLVKNNRIELDDVIGLINEVKPEYTILLNISQVGTRHDDDNSIISEVIKKTPYTQHIIGGGITGESIGRYQRRGIDNFLVGTVLHEGQLSEKDIQ